MTVIDEGAASDGSPNHGVELHAYFPFKEVVRLVVVYEFELPDFVVHFAIRFALAEQLQR